MSDRFHITEDGPKPCTASIRDCKYGGASAHYDNFEAANADYERVMNNKYGRTKSFTKNTPLEQPPKDTTNVNMDAVLNRYRDISPLAKDLKYNNPQININPEDSPLELKKITENVRDSITIDKLMDSATFYKINKIQDLHKENISITDKCNKVLMENGYNIEMTSPGVMRNEIRNGSYVSGRGYLLRQTPDGKPNDRDKEFLKATLEHDFKMNGRITNSYVKDPEDERMLSLRRGLFRTNYHVQPVFGHNNKDKATNFKTFDEAYNFMLNGSPETY